MSSSLLIAGFSARAAAQSARRAGFEVYAVDAFGDRDLRTACSQCAVVANYPADLLAASARLPAAPWMYVGGLENEPDLVADISQTRQLFGNDPQVLRKVRDPFLLAETIRESGLHTPVAVAMPEMRHDLPTEERNQWLWKL